MWYPVVVTPAEYQCCAPPLAATFPSIARPPPAPPRARVTPLPGHSDPHNVLHTQMVKNLTVNVENRCIIGFRSRKLFCVVTGQWSSCGGEYHRLCCATSNQAKRYKQSPLPAHCRTAGLRQGEDMMLWCWRPDSLLS